MDLIEAALTRQALHDLVVAVARGVDRGDATMIARAFHPDADVFGGVLEGKAPDYARDVVALVRANLQSCFHTVSNAYFEVSGDRARGETCVLAHLIARAEPRVETLMGGRYLDRFERRQERWLISERTFVQEWSKSRPAPPETHGMVAGWAPDHPSVAFWSDASAPRPAHPA